MNADRHATRLGLTMVAILAAFAAAQCGGGGSPSQPTPAPTVSGNTAALSSLSLSASSVVGGQPVVGTATLSAAAPAGGSVVALTSVDPVTVPASVTVPAGSTAATFTVETRAVGGAMAASITGTYAGSTARATLSVQPFVPDVATASFGVTGQFVTDTCSLINGGTALGCTFNGSTSTAPGTIVAWDWSYTIATTISQTTSEPILQNPTAACALLPTPPLASGAESLVMTVRLKVRDNLGNVSAEAVNPDVRLLPHGSCGY